MSRSCQARCNCSSQGLCDVFSLPATCTAPSDTMKSTGRRFPGQYQLDFSKSCFLSPVVSSATVAGGQPRQQQYAVLFGKGSIIPYGTHFSWLIQGPLHRRKLTSDTINLTMASWLRSSLALGRSEPTIIILLNGHSIKSPSKYLHPQINAIIRPHHSFPLKAQRTTQKKEKKDCRRQRLGKIRGKLLDMKGANAPMSPQQPWLSVDEASQQGIHELAVAAQHCSMEVGGGAHKLRTCSQLIAPRGGRVHLLMGRGPW